MKKLLLLNYCYPGQGTFHRCYYFGKHMAKKGWRVDLVCSSAKGGDWLIRTRKETDNYYITTLPSPISTGSAFAYFVRTVLGILWVLFRRYDVIHSFGMAYPSTAIPAITARWLRRRCKVVIDWDDAFGDAYSKIFGAPYHVMMKTLEKATPHIAAPAAITVASRYFKVKLLEKGIPMEKVYLVPNGADTDTIKPGDQKAARTRVGWSDREVIILAMGHNYFGSLRVLLETFSLVLRKKPHAKLKMVGHLMKIGKLAQSMDRWLKEFEHLSRKIEWVGEVPRDRVGDYLRAADCLVLPMENSIIDEARAPVRIGDYLASGKPIVANAVGYARDVLTRVHPNGVCEDPDNRQEFADMIVKVLDDATLAENMGKAGLRLAEGEQNWNSICSALEGIYDGSA